MKKSGLSLVQRHLDSLYHTDLVASVDQFVIGEHARQHLQSAGTIQARPGAREEVYVFEDDDGMSIAVYIDAAAHRAVALNSASGLLRLDASSFADFCVALEAVSHFLLLAHRAKAETPVTQLELELQAEIDKYLAARLLAWRLCPGPMPQALRHVLFADYALEGGLDPVQRQRYLKASQLALQYCDYLERAYLREGRLLALLRELRRFYRADQEERCRRISALAA